MKLYRIVRSTGWWKYKVQKKGWLFWWTLYETDAKELAVSFVEEHRFPLYIADSRG